VKEELKKIKHFNLRVTRIELDDDKEEWLISNLAKEKFSTKDLKELLQFKMENRNILRCVEK